MACRCCHQTSWLRRHKAHTRDQLLSFLRVSGLGPPGMLSTARNLSRSDYPQQNRFHSCTACTMHSVLLPSSQQHIECTYRHQQRQTSPQHMVSRLHCRRTSDPRGKPYTHDRTARSAPQSRVVCRRTCARLHTLCRRWFPTMLNPTRRPHIHDRQHWNQVSTAHSPWHTAANLRRLRCLRLKNCRPRMVCTHQHRQRHSFRHHTARTLRCLPLLRSLRRSLCTSQSPLRRPIQHHANDIRTLR